MGNIVSNLQRNQLYHYPTHTLQKLGILVIAIIFGITLADSMVPSPRIGYVRMLDVGHLQVFFNSLILVTPILLGFNRQTLRGS